MLRFLILLPVSDVVSPRIGARKLHYLLNTQADKRLNIGRDRLFNLLDEYRLPGASKTGISQNYQQSSSLLPTSKPA